MSWRSYYDNCSGDPDLELPITSDYFDALYTSQKVFMVICFVLTLINFAVFVKVALHIKRTLESMKGIMITSLWAMVLSPTLSLIAMMSMVMPRTFLLREILMSGFLSVVMYKFVQHIKLCIRHEGKEDQVLATEIRFDVPPLCCCCKCLPPVRPTPKNVQIVKFLVLQFPFVTIITSTLIMCLWLDERYTVGEFETDNAYPFLQFSKVASTMLAMFGLGVYYKLCVGATHSFYVVQKYIGLKITLLLANLQDILFNILRSAGVFSERTCVPEIVMSNFSQDVTFVVEMLLVTAFNAWTYQRPIEPAHHSDVESNHSAGKNGRPSSNKHHLRAEDGTAAYYNNDRSRPRENVEVITPGNNAALVHPSGGGRHSNSMGHEHNKGRTY